MKRISDTSSKPLPRLRELKFLRTVDARDNEDEEHQMDEAEHAEELLQPPACFIG